MEEDFVKSVAAQLREPEGELGQQVAEKMNESNAQMNREAIRLLDLQNADRVLEIGMANGNFIPELFNTYPTIQYTGVDASPSMVADAMLRNEQLMRVDKVKFLRAVAKDLPFPDESFNKIFTLNCIYFWDNPSEELSSIYRVLKPGGIFLVGIRPRHQMEKLPFSKYGFCLYSEAEITTLLEENNFHVLDTVSHEESSFDLTGEKIELSSLFLLSQRL